MHKVSAVFKMTISFVSKIASLKPNIASFFKFDARSSPIGIRLQERAYSPNYRPLSIASRFEKLSQPDEAEVAKVSRNSGGVAGNGRDWNTFVSLLLFLLFSSRSRSLRFSRQDSLPLSRFPVRHVGFVIRRLGSGLTPSSKADKVQTRPCISED